MGRDDPSAWQGSVVDDHVERIQAVEGAEDPDRPPGAPWLRRVLERMRDPMGPSPDDRQIDLAASELASLRVAGLSRRRLMVAAIALAVAWVGFAFVQQVSEAAAITSRAVEMRAANAQLEARVSAAELELIQIQGLAYVEQQARAYRLGKSNEIPFTLEADPPPLGPDAPGSAATSVGADQLATSPLENWLSLLFGPTR